MREVDGVVIGGGSAGLAAACKCKEEGIENVVVLERDKELGGILNQCIHNGFGLHTFNEELSGPAYAERFIDKAKALNVECKLNTMVTHISKDKVVEYVNPEEGYVRVQAKAIVLAMGCRERTRGAISIPGYRPVGVYNAGTAQRYLNMDGYLVGKRVFILGSGDIGLIMARRMTLEGAKVLGVAEIMPYSNGLARNMKQCLEDFDIPLYLSHTITNIEGKERVSGVTISEVDSNRNVVPGTEKHFDVDTLLLSVGLIPENSLTEEAEIEMNPVTKGAMVNESYETSIPGIFACGNVLHVHDLVDFVSAEGAKAGESAARYIREELKSAGGFNCKAKQNVSYVMPTRINVENVKDKVEFLFRVRVQARNATLNLYKDGELFRSIPKRHVAPAEMEKLIMKKSDLEGIKESFEIELVVD